MSYLKLSTTLPWRLSTILHRAMIVHLEVSYLKRLSTLPQPHLSRLSRAMLVYQEMSSLYHRLTTPTMDMVKLCVLLCIITPCQAGTCKLTIGIFKLTT